MAGRSCTIIPRAIPPRRRRLAAGLTLALTVLACRPTVKDRIALVGGTVIEGGQAMPNMVVLIHGTHIESVVPRDGFEIPKSATEIDVGGEFILPGFIDAHAHTVRWALSRYLAFGVTTVRDLHSPQDTILAMKEQANLGGIVSPRLYIAGAAIDGNPPTFSDATGVDNNDEARRAVDSRVVAGVDQIKAYTRITPPLLKAIVDEAGTFHVPVAAHLGLVDALTAAKLGVKSIEHMSGVPESASRDASKFYAAHRSGFFPGWNYFERSWAGLDSASLSRVAHGLAEARVVLVPTLVLHDTFSRLDDPSLLLDSTLKLVPAEAITRWNVPDLKQRAGWTDADYAAFRKSRPNQDLFVREFRAAGGLIAAGTDASNQMLVPGLSLHRELALLVNAGLTPSDAILTATRNAAALLNADSIGAIAPNKVADLVILTANPLTDIANTQRIDRVMVRGLLLKADSLRTHW